MKSVFTILPKFMLATPFLFRIKVRDTTMTIKSMIEVAAK